MIPDCAGLSVGIALAGVVSCVQIQRRARFPARDCDPPAVPSTRVDADRDRCAEPAAAHQPLSRDRLPPFPDARPAPLRSAPPVPAASACYADQRNIRDLPATHSWRPQPWGVWPPAPAYSFAGERSWRVRARLLSRKSWSFGMIIPMLDKAVQTSSLMPWNRTLIRWRSYSSIFLKPLSPIRFDRKLAIVICHQPGARGRSISPVPRSCRNRLASGAQAG